MIDYNRYTLDNGLTVILHQDNSTPLVTVNVLYKVGSKNENPKMTGFAHLFEHLMFGGSVNVKDFDTPIQKGGGDNNAFTNSDITNFYEVLPAENLETALWLESDRMLRLDFNQKSLDLEKKVVVEEFKETSINQPYGELWHELSALAYEQHPYRWPTIGLEPSHIEHARLEDVEQFFNNHYSPNNAVLVLSGKFEIVPTKELIKKWFGPIPSAEVAISSYPSEPPQSGFKSKTLARKVPSEAIYMAFHMPDRTHPDFIAYDILSDVLSGGRSSRFYQRLLKGSNVFSNITAYVSGTVDPGLFVIEGKMLPGASVDQARALIWQELKTVQNELVGQQELNKVKNSLISSVAFSEVSITHKAMNLAYYEMLGDVSQINEQEAEIESVGVKDLQRIAVEAFREENCSEIIYKQEEELVSA